MATEEDTKWKATCPTEPWEDSHVEALIPVQSSGLVLREQGPGSIHLMQAALLEPKVNPCRKEGTML